jgi:hypothetical protein
MGHFLSFDSNYFPILGTRLPLTVFLRNFGIAEQFFPTSE